MNLAVAIQAAAVHDECRRPIARQTVGRVGNARVSALRMTGLTQQGRPLGQHRLVDRAMRIMAQQTVLADRWMLEQIGSTQLGVAAPA